MRLRLFPSWNATPALAPIRRIHRRMGSSRQRLFQGWERSLQPGPFRCWRAPRLAFIIWISVPRPQEPLPAATIPDGVQAELFKGSVNALVLCVLYGEEPTLQA